jgi:cytoskeletal protein RodZ
MKKKLEGMSALAVLTLVIGILILVVGGIYIYNLNSTNDNSGPSGQVDDSSSYYSSDEQTDTDDESIYSYTKSDSSTSDSSVSSTDSSASSYLVNE